MTTGMKEFRTRGRFVGSTANTDASRLFIRCISDPIIKVGPPLTRGTLAYYTYNRRKMIQTPTITLSRYPSDHSIEFVLGHEYMHHVLFKEVGWIACSRYDYIEDPMAYVMGETGWTWWSKTYLTDIIVGFLLGISPLIILLIMLLLGALP